MNDDASQVDRAIRRTREITGNGSIAYLSHGMEGVVTKDGTDVYKYFHSGSSAFQVGQLEFIRERLLGRSTRHLVQLKEVYEEGNELIFRMEMFDGERYSGGHPEEIRDLLRECQQLGIAHRNIHPKNLLVNEGTLKICDLGNSIRATSPSEFREMAKRAYLSYRYHFRSDLAKLMTDALRDEAIPALFGFEYFWDSLIDQPYGAGLDEVISRALGDTRGLDILDLRAMGTSSVRERVNSKLEGLPLREGRFDRIICNLDDYALLTDAEMYGVLKALRGRVKDNGKTIVAVSDPFSTFVEETPNHVKELPRDATFGEEFQYRRINKVDERVTIVAHRPYNVLRRLFRKSGFDLVDVIETPGLDCLELAPASDYLVLVLEPIYLPPMRNVSLLIKVSPVEWESVEFQIKHIVDQLDTPSQFCEIVVVTDNHNGPFLRQYASPNPEALAVRLEKLVNEGWIDRMVCAPGDPAAVAKTYRKWFSLESEKTHSANGQHMHTSLYGLDQCRGDYVVQTDSDCIVVRKDLSRDFIGEMLAVMDQDPRAISVSFKVAKEGAEPYSTAKGGKEWRTEVRFSLFRKERLESILPLPNSLDSERRLISPWHRAVDRAIVNRGLHSYRGGDCSVFFIHVPNSMKTDLNVWYNIVKQAEAGKVPPAQYGDVDLDGRSEDWYDKRVEEFVFVVRGRNVTIPKLRRMMDSVQAQHLDSWGMVFIDAASVNGMEEYIENVAMRKFPKASLWRNWTALTPMENTKIAISELCGNPDSVIITLDADDALIGEEVLDTLRRYYDGGVDLTVGSMLRTDKEKRYPVDFLSPREHNGGNVWQHLRSFRKGLFDAIPEQYFKIEGDWIPHTEDWAFMLPMVEIASNPQHVQECLYFYEPSEQKGKRSIRDREMVIREVLCKPSLRARKPRPDVGNSKAAHDVHQPASGSFKSPKKADETIVDALDIP